MRLRPYLSEILCKGEMAFHARRLYVIWAASEMKHHRAGVTCPRVAVCVDKGCSYGRGVLRGIADYAETFGPWSLSIDPRSAGTYPRDWLKDWRGDGLLAYIESPELARRIQRLRIPTVELFGHRADLGLLQVGNDDVTIGRLAAEHLLERQFKRFAFSGYPEELWVEGRHEGFATALSRTGLECARFICAQWEQSLERWENNQRRLTAWLCGLPKPIGLMACSDRHAQRILEACRRAEIAVPEEIAVIGVDNDEETCRLSYPSLTSVIDDTRRVGYEAARLLDQLISGEVTASGAKRISIPPLGVATRRSTDVTAVEDRLVADAMRLIRHQACEGLRVESLIAQYHVSRSVLYRRFEAALGRSPHQEILRVKVDRVKNLLTQTELTLEKIAEMAGFEHSEYLSVAFKREVGMAPGAYRQSAGNDLS